MHNLDVNLVGQTLCKLLCGVLVDEDEIRGSVNSCLVSPDDILCSTKTFHRNPICASHSLFVITISSKLWLAEGNNEEVGDRT